MEEYIITPQGIKKLVEKLSDTKNIQKQTRKREFTYARYVYFKLCFKYTKSSQEKISGVVGRITHSTSTHGEKEFNTHSGKKYFQFYDMIYKKACSIINDLEKLSISEVKKNHRITLINCFKKTKNILLENKNEKDATKIKAVVRANKILLSRIVHKRFKNRLKYNF